MTSCSSAHTRIAETSPPSWPTCEQLGISRPGEHDVSGDAGHLVLGALSTEHERVDLGLPRPEAGAGPRAHRASLHPVGAVLGAPVLFDLPRAVGRRVVVLQDVVRAGDDAAGASGAESGGDDFFVEVGPMRFFGGHVPTVLQGSRWRPVPEAACDPDCPTRLVPSPILRVSGKRLNSGSWSPGNGRCRHAPRETKEGRRWAPRRRRRARCMRDRDEPI